MKQGIHALSAVLVLILLMVLGSVPVWAGYVDNGDGTVSDTRTGLMWQQGDEQNGSVRTWEEALAYCEGLHLAGHDDWRLPNVRELASLVDDSRYDPAIDTRYFPGCHSAWYWSGSSSAYNSGYAWGVGFYGDVGWLAKYDPGGVRCVRAGPGSLGPLTIAQSPMSGPPGTTFTQWGTGFTPGGTATLHFKKPDGTEYPSQSQPLDDIGHFEITYTAPLDKPPGTYTWWAIDDATGRKSNEVSYVIDGNPVAVSFVDVRCLSRLANEFELFLDVSINGAAPAESFCGDYTVEIRSDKKADGLQIVETSCDYLGPADADRSRYEVSFRLRTASSGAKPAYFEDGEIYIVSKTGAHPPRRISEINDFAVYGTNFDMSKHAWKFSNGSWLLTILGTDCFKAADQIDDYLTWQKRDDFWNSVGSLNIHKVEISHGLCYGLATSAIANFNHQGDAWGLGSIDEWKSDIDGHWSTVEDRVNSPYKPFGEDEIFSLEWDFQSAKKIMYYHVSQPWYAEGADNGDDLDSWEGKDGHQDVEDRKYIVDILKQGSPVSLGFRVTKDGKKIGQHEVVIVQCISWNHHDRYAIWDNNLPYKEGHVPYLSWYVSKFDSYTKGKHYFLKTRKSQHPGSIYDDQIDYALEGYPWILPANGDSQNIYGQNGIAAAAREQKGASHAIPTHVLLTGTADSYPAGLEITLVGARVDGVNLKESGAPVTLVPNGEGADGQAVIETSLGGQMNLLWLPCDQTYRVQATKFSDCPLLKVFVRIPKADGSVQQINYENVETGETDATRVYFYVGVGNQDLAIRRTSGTVSGNGRPLATEDLYQPDHNDSFMARIDSPASFRAVRSGSTVELSWVNTDQPQFDRVTVVRKTEGYPASPSDGDVIYEGRGNSAMDSGLSEILTYYYSAFSIDTNGTRSEPATVSVQAYRYSITGHITVDGGTDLADTTLVLTDSGGRPMGSCFTGPDGRYALPNLEMNHYILSAEKLGYVMDDPVRAVTVSDGNQVVDFTAHPVPALQLLGGPEEVATGQTVHITWTYRHIEDSERVTLSLYRGDTWETLASSVPILAGEYPWQVSGAATDDALLRLSLEDNSAVYDDQPVTITDVVTAGFSASPTSGEMPLTVQFTDYSTGAIDSRTWDFGDGGTSTEQNPVHVYDEEGTYTVKLAVTGPDGSDYDIKVNYISVQTPTTPGDMNGDGQVTATDALCVLEKCVGMCPTHCGACDEMDGDVNGDGQESASDALCILQYFVGLPSCLD